MALPAATLLSASAARSTAARLPDLRWAALDLLDSDADDPHFVAEIDDDGARTCASATATADAPWSGDGVPGHATASATAGGTGRAPSRSSTSSFAQGKNDVIASSVRNPLPSRRRVEPEPVAEVKMLAPDGVPEGPRSAPSPRERLRDAGAVPALSRRATRVQGAAGALIWTGSWYEAGVARRSVRLAVTSRRRCADDDPRRAAAATAAWDTISRWAPPLRCRSRLELDLCVWPTTSARHVLAAVHGARRPRAT